MVNQDGWNQNVTATPGPEVRADMPDHEKVLSGKV